MSTNDALPIPDAAKEDPKSLELIRIWIANGDQEVILRPDVWEDPAHWGIMLCDLMRHLSRAYEESHGYNPVKTYARIKEMLDLEYASPSDDPRGGLVDGA